jgi:GalNAc5-diNAcBac-PP-undecaprenol beta-1,3-glucosyltransferase
MSETLVTIAIPTYCRPQLLRQALEAVAAQDHAPLEVIVSDNASGMVEVAQTIEAFRTRIPGLRLHEHNTNVGAVANFFWCLHAARGRYFMWLADDDGLAPQTVSALADLLDHEPDAVTAVPHWLLRRHPNGGELRRARGYASRHRLARVLRYCWYSTDAFFYALHRTDVLRSARQVEYAWPNRGMLANWAYPYLLDMVLAGRVIATTAPQAQWINNEFADKTYALPGRSPVERVRAALRRVNVHAIYASKVWRTMGVGAAVAVAAVSLTSLACEPLRLVARRFGWAAR